MKELLSFFINQVFVGVFQYDSGTPKHGFGIEKKVWILTKITEFLWSGTQGPIGKILGFQ